ncbi:hypothetical protein Tco_0341518 [Tanacetum coccineum]
MSRVCRGRGTLHPYVQVEVVLEGSVISTFGYACSRSAPACLHLSPLLTTEAISFIRNPLDVKKSVSEICIVQPSFSLELEGVGVTFLKFPDSTGRERDPFKLEDGFCSSLALLLLRFGRSRFRLLGFGFRNGRVDSSCRWFCLVWVAWPALVQEIQVSLIPQLRCTLMLYNFFPDRCGGLSKFFQHPFSIVDVEPILTIPQRFVAIGALGLYKNPEVLSRVGGEEKARSLVALSNVHSNLENWTGLRSFLSLTIAVDFPIGNPSNCGLARFVNQYRRVMPLRGGACSALAMILQQLQSYEERRLQG